MDAAAQQDIVKGDIMPEVQEGDTCTAQVSDLDKCKNDIHDNEVKDSPEKIVVKDQHDDVIVEEDIVSNANPAAVNEAVLTANTLKGDLVNEHEKEDVVDEHEKGGVVKENVEDNARENVEDDAKEEELLIDEHDDVMDEALLRGREEQEDEEGNIDAVSVSAVSDDSGIQDTIQLDEDAFSHQRMAWPAREQQVAGPEQSRAEQFGLYPESGQHQGQLYWQQRALGQAHGKAHGQHAGYFQGHQRGKTRLRAESKEAMYRQALTLMSERCATSHSLQRLGKQQIRDLRRTPIASLKKPPFGPVTPQYFYIHQKKPSPMQPLKAWKGYHGNVYFEPIGIKKAEATPPPSASRAAIDNMTGPLREILSRGTHLQSSSPSPSKHPREPKDTRPMTRSPTRAALASRPAPRTPAPHQIVHLDKRAVLDTSNTSLQEDLLCVVGLESPGSLCVLPSEQQERDARTAAGVTSATKERICKGSVAHKVFTMKNRNFPLLSVSGDKFASPQRPSPLLQTQTTYSLSSQRLNMNSPDLMYGASYEKLPPLEQLRASLRHMDTAPQPADLIQIHTHPSSHHTPPPPLIKYSAQQQRQAHGGHAGRRSGHRVQ